MSDKPNKSNYPESTESGKYVVYVFFTKLELKQIERHCNGMRKNMSRWIADLIREELQLQERMHELDELE